MIPKIFMWIPSGRFAGYGYPFGGGARWGGGSGWRWGDFVWGNYSEPHFTDMRNTESWIDE